MARTTPARTKNFARSPGERRLYAVLEGLPDRMSVIHGPDWFGKAGRAEGEADFVIVDPEAGVLVVEVKGGSIACGSGQWRQGGQGGRPWKVIDPHGQGRDSQHALRRHLTQAVGAEDVLFGHVVWFPDADVSAVPLPPGAPKSLTLDQGSLADPAAAVAETFAFWRKLFPGKGGGGPEMAQAIFDHLAPSFDCPVVEQPEVEAPLPLPLPPSPSPQLSRRHWAPPGVARHLLAALAWIGHGFLVVAREVMLTPVRFVVDVVRLVFNLLWSICGWCWEKFKMMLTVAFLLGLCIGFGALLVRFGFHRTGATMWIYGGFGGSFAAYAIHELCGVLENRTARATQVLARWGDAARVRF